MGGWAHRQQVSTTFLTPVREKLTNLSCAPDEDLNLSPCLLSPQHELSFALAQVHLIHAGCRGLAGVHAGPVGWLGPCCVCFPSPPHGEVARHGRQTSARR